MPPDTTYIPGVTGPPPQFDSTSIIGKEMDSQQLQVYLQHLTDSLENGYTVRQTSGNDPYNGVDFMPIFLLVIIGILIYKWGWPSIYRKINLQKKVKDVAVMVATAGIQYHDWLKQHNPYYNSLSPLLQQRFLQRTIVFMQSKEFRFHSMEEEEYIKVLVSGAAVQVTFGLQNYLLDYFPIIHVIRKEYILDIDNEMYDGHVSRTGIYISWNHFTEGFENYTDCRNVGLHEMAHAVAYDVFLGQEDNADWKFKQRLQEFREDGMPIFRAMREKCNPVLDSYGATNFDEFWAVCVETFFENPTAFAQAMPDLYTSLVELLNQNPVKPTIIENEMVAGIVN